LWAHLCLYLRLGAMSSQAQQLGQLHQLHVP